MIRRSSFKEAEKEDKGVIRKVGNKWRILKKNRKDYWDAEYDTKADAQAALRAYWVNKGECKMRNLRRQKLLKEFVTKNDVRLGKALDDVCAKVAERELDSAKAIEKALRVIEKGAKALNCDFSLVVGGDRGHREISIEELCDRAEDWLNDGHTYLSVEWVEGEPGDNYMLVFKDMEDDELMEECAKFMFSPRD